SAVDRDTQSIRLRQLLDVVADSAADAAIAGRYHLADPSHRLQRALLGVQKGIGSSDLLPDLRGHQARVEAEQQSEGGEIWPRHAADRETAAIQIVKDGAHSASKREGQQRQGYFPCQG